MKEWQRKEAELLKKENAYIEQFNFFQKILDNHLYFCILFVLLLMAGFLIGFGIGSVV